MITYEEMRVIVLDIFAGKIQLKKSFQSPDDSKYLPQQFIELQQWTVHVLAQRAGQKIPDDPYMQGVPQPQLDKEGQVVFLELFWDLFRQGVISLGLDEINAQFPWFHVTELGKKVADGERYFFHDVSSYNKFIKKEVPEINKTTLLYMEESLQAFYAGCYLAATVMLGVAAEHSFLLLLEEIDKNPHKKGKYSSISSERTILAKISKFNNILRDEDMKNLQSDIKENLESNFNGILHLIRQFRNESGHPSGNIISREQTFVLLQLFVPYCKKIYQLKSFFKAAC